MPQTVFDVGDPITSRYKAGVTPDGTTTATITVTRPDGTTIAPPAIGPWENVDEKTAQWYATDDGTVSGTTLAAAGDWLAVWKITGTGANVATKVYSVAPPPGASTRPAWSPFLSDVADHVPFLTIDQASPGDQIYLGTFTGYTSPTDEQAQRHIDIAVSVVGAGFGTLTGALPRMARSVAAIWAAASLCRAFARDSDTRTLADALGQQATADLKILQTAVDNASENALNPVPVLIAPTPVPWGDDLDTGRHKGQLRWIIWPN
jgi:hypothetical protein